MHEHFSEAEVVELTYAMGTFIGYGKQIMILGLEPEICRSPSFPHQEPDPRHLPVNETGDPDADCCDRRARNIGLGGS